MSDIGYLMQLQQQINKQGQEDLQGIGENIGNIFAQRGQRSFEQAATKFFMNENNQTPEKIQEFSSMYPQIPKQAVWSIAGQVATQQKAQRLKDIWPTLQSKIKFETAKDPSWIPDMKTLTEIGINPIDMPDVVAALTKIKELHPDIKFEKTSPGETATQTIGGRPTDVTIKGQPIPEKKDVDIINPDGTRSEKVTETEAKNREASGWTRGTRLFTPASEKPLRSLKTIYGPNGQTREVQVGDNFIPPSGWSLKVPYKPEDNTYKLGRIEDKKQLMKEKKEQKYQETKNSLDKWFTDAVTKAGGELAPTPDGGFEIVKGTFGVGLKGKDSKINSIKTVYDKALRGIEKTYGTEKVEAPKLTKPQLADEKKQAAEAIKARPELAGKIKAMYKQETGQDYE